MAHWTTRSNLSAAQFPFYSKWMGRSVIVPQFDQNPDSSLSLDDKTKDRGQPQIFYMHNCVPTSQGFQSIGYEQKIIPAPYTFPLFDSAFLLRNASNDRFLYSPGVGTGFAVLNNVFDPYIGVWATYNINASVAAPLVTTAYINGQTYIFIEGTGCYLYDKTVPGLTSVTLTGLTIANVIGITAANGYLIAWTGSTVAWSSVVDPTDFVPSLQTGAGSGDVNDIKGPISFCLQISGGFIVYTERNAVGASYTGNVRYPFVFKEVVNSGGLYSLERVVSDSSNAEHYAFTTSGLQKIDRQVAVNVFPEVTDFFTSRLMETFDEATKTFTQENLSSPVVHKLALTDNRYLVCSYGKTSLTHALVYDLTLKRWCRFKIDHVDCFDFFDPEKFTAPIEDFMKGSVGFLKADGSVYIVNFSSTFAASSGVLILGKFQFLRNSMIELIGMSWESANLGTNFTAFILPSLDGTNFNTPVTPHLQLSAGGLNQYLCRVTGRNVSVGVIGNFNLVSQEIEFLKAGDR